MQVSLIKTEAEKFVEKKNIYICANPKTFGQDCIYSTVNSFFREHSQP